MAKTNCKTDWSKCCLCQQDKNESLTSPSENPSKRETDGYTNIAKNIPLFYELNAMPILLDPDRLNDGTGIEATLRGNNAKYHQACRLLFNNTKLDRARKRSSTINENQYMDSNGKRFKLSRKSSNFKSNECFLCEKHEDKYKLTHSMTMKLNERLNRCAYRLNDERLLSILSAGDVVAQELKYHPTCLSALYNRERALLNSQEKSTKEEEESESNAKAIAFSELITYIVETCNSTAGPNIFRLADLSVLYQTRVSQLGFEIQVNSTRLKEQLLSHLPELEAYNKGRDVLLAFQRDIGKFMEETGKTSDAIHLAKSAAILRKEMLAHKWTFENMLADSSNVEESIPSSLLEFISMIEHGADIKSQIGHSSSKSDLAIAQLLQYNCFGKYKEDATTHRHSRSRETPFAVYTGLTVFSKTRKRQLVDMLYENGLSISYDRVLEISAKLGEAVVRQYVEEGVVCPPLLKKSLFTTAAIDNIDHNPSATTAQSSFHGTSISVFQHPSPEKPGVDRPPIEIGAAKIKKVPELPESFTNIPPAHLPQDPEPSVTENFDFPDSQLIASHIKEEYEWLEKVSTAEGNELEGISWSAYHSSKKRSQPFEKSITSLLPLLRDEVHSAATIKHVVGKIFEIVNLLNPNQIPVIAMDQPLYALAKQIQWYWRQYGEDKFVLMFGGLHIEMAALRSLGTLLQGSGWTGLLTEAEIASAGTAQSFLSASSVTRTRYAHQVTASALYKLLKTSYLHYSEMGVDDGDALDFESWCTKRKSESPQFCYWHLVLSMELSTLLLVRSFREADFDLYRQSLFQLLPYFFANNNVNYSRWLTIHLKDMMSIEDKHPTVAEEFHKGNFVIHKSKREFSALPIDQAHEQNNAVIKGDGGAIGITEDESALRRWMTAGPEVSRLLSRYDSKSERKNNQRQHHEETPTSQKSFLDKVEKLYSTIAEISNPFEEESNDLYALDTKDVADTTKAQMVKTHLSKGKEQFQAFVDGLKKEDRSKSFYGPIKKNCTSFFSHEPETNISKEDTIKEDRNLFSRLFISCQSRECDLSDFFKYENQAYPASLSDSGKLYSCQKSQLVDVLKDKVKMPDSEPEVDCIVVDGSALVNSSPPGTVKTFEAYAIENIIPRIQQLSSKYKRTDIIFDVYLDDSLKSETRTKRGVGVRRKVTPSSKTPTNWNGFLRNSTNKTELFKFLADQIAKTASENLVIVTKEEDALANQEVSLTDISPCCHEEADTRIFVHVKSAVLQGNKSIMVKANDTDVVVLAVHVMVRLKESGLEKLWIAFGQGKYTCWIPIHDLVESIGSSKASGILFFHAFTGCDVVSAFRGKGKKTAWQTWNICDDDINQTFQELSSSPSMLTDAQLARLEKFVVAMYDKSSMSAKVDETRLDLFARKQRSYLCIPPTQASLRQHAKRATYQASIWFCTMELRPNLGSPSDWGWVRDGTKWKIHWSDLSPIAANCQQLTKCGCKKNCKNRCKCYRCGLPCTRLCNCTCNQN